MVTGAPISLLSECLRTKQWLNCRLIARVNHFILPVYIVAKVETRRLRVELVVGFVACGVRVILLHEGGPLTPRVGIAELVQHPTCGKSLAIVSILCVSDILDDELSRELVAKDEDSVTERYRDIGRWVGAHVWVLVVCRIGQPVQTHRHQLAVK